MRLMVPASTLEDAKNLLQNGADDIYLGIQSEIFNQYSFNGRAKKSKNEKVILPSFEEFKKICLCTHSNGGSIYFLANTPVINGGFSVFKREFLKYVDSGIRAGADYVILGDLLSIKWVRSAFPNISIAASSYLEIQNLETLKFVEDLGVKQAILSYQSSLEEIKEMCTKSKMQIEIFGHGGCSFYVGTCNMFHEMGENIKIGYPCRAKYLLYNGDKFIGEKRALDCFKMCSLCKIKEMLSYNIHSLKIVGRDLQLDYILEIVKTYSRVIKLCTEDEHIDVKSNIPIWWKKTWCDAGNLCRYGGSINECN